MSGLDTSQVITDELSMHAAQYHHHSRLPDVDPKAVLQARDDEPAAATTTDVEPGPEPFVQ